NVLVFLGVPLIAGFATRWIGEKRKGREWYEERFVPRIDPWALYGLLFTIVLLFALQGEAITSNPLDVARIALPLFVYFALMWFAGLLLGKGMGLGYARSTTLAFTAAGTNFALAIAVAVGTSGATSGHAPAGVVGPWSELAVLVGVVYVSLRTARPWFRPAPSGAEMSTACPMLLLFPVLSAAGPVGPERGAPRAPPSPRRCPGL